MSKTVEQMKERIQQEIDARQKAMVVFEQLPASLIAEAFPQGRWYYDWIGNFEFTLPYSFELINTVKEYMELQNPEWKYQREQQLVWDSSAAAGYFIYYQLGEYPNRITFEFAFRSGEKGTTCILNKIGEKQIPVYEVVCSQQAAAEF